MIKNVCIPNINSTSIIKIVDIPISVGEKISKDDIIATIEAGKASIDIPCPFNGTIDKISVSIGDIVENNSIILSVAEEIKTKEKNDINKSEILTTKNIYASPSVRRLARKFDININEIKNPKDNTRITQKDIEATIKNNHQNINKNIHTEETYVLKINKIKSISKTIITKSWNKIPHVTQFINADISNLLIFYKNEKEKLKEKNIKLTLLPFIIKIICNALKLFPLFNSSYDEKTNNITIKKYYNIGIVVNTENGLFIPILKNIDKKNIIEICIELNEKVEKTKNNTLENSDLENGCFTISNLGNKITGFFTPIIKYPETAILGISKYEQALKIVNNKIRRRTLLPLSLSYNHIVVNGIDAANFINKICEQLNDIRTTIM
ncbi:MAG TPA: 2-oxo acid dehydrogenase subunit E2 [Candidatus Azoamicus sp. OHIO1]